MQELMFPETTIDPRNTFDEYRVVSLDQVTPERYVVLFRKEDTNLKNYWLVADRIKVGDKWLLGNGKEFGHAENRAHRYYDMRRAELAGE